MKNFIRQSTEKFTVVFQNYTIIIVAFLFTSFCNAQQLDLTTKRFYDLNTQLNVQDIKITKDNGFIVVGNAQFSSGQQPQYGSFIFYNDSSTNISSNFHWEKTYSTFSNVEDFSFNKVEQLLDSSFLVAGKIYNVQTNSYGGVLVRVDQYGNEIWKKSLEASLNEPLSITDIALESDSTFLVLGSKMGNNDQSYLCRIDTNGNLIWQKSFSMEGNNILELLALERLNNGSILLSGKSYADLTSTYGVLIMLDSAWNVQWAQQNNQLYSSFSDVISDQNHIFCRNMSSMGYNSICAFDITGNNLWNQVINDQDMSINGLNTRRLICFDLDSNLIVYNSNFSYGSYCRISRQGNSIGGFAIIGHAQGIDIDKEDGNVVVLASGPAYGVKSSLVLNNHFAVTKFQDIQSSQSLCLWDYSFSVSPESITFTSINLFSGDFCHLSDAITETIPFLVTIDHNCVEFLGGIDQNEGFDFDIFPNPTSEFLEIKFDPSVKIGSSTGAILDIYGKEVINFELNTFENHINVSTIPSGIYWIKIGSKIKRISKV